MIGGRLRGMPDPTSPSSPPGRWLALVAVCLGTAMLLIDVTIVNVALPSISRDLGTGFDELQWVVDAYALVLAALLLGAGALGDRHGHKALYIAGLGTFAVASLACGLAPGAGTLITARAIQGMGAAAMFAATAAILAQTYSGRERGIAFGVYGAVAGASAALGPIAGGVLTEGISWRWIFFVNLPLSVVAVVTTLRAVRSQGRPDAPRVDLPGLVTSAGISGGITFALIDGPQDGWTATPTLIAIAVAVVCLPAFVAIERRRPHPLLDLQLLRDPRTGGILLGSLCLTLSAFAMLAFASVWLQSLRGLGPIAAGASFLPLSVVSFGVSAFVGRKLHDSGQHRTIGGGLLLIGAGCLLQAHLGVRSSWSALAPGLVLVGAGVGLAAPVLVSAMLASVAPQRAGMASGAVNTARQLGLAIGIAALGSIVQTRLGGVLSADGIAGAGDIARAAASGATGQVVAAAPAGQREGLQDSLAHAFAAGLNSGFVVAGVIGLAAGAAVWFLVGARRPSATPTAGAPASSG